MTIDNKLQSISNLTCSSNNKWKKKSFFFKFSAEDKQTYFPLKEWIRTVLPLLTITNKSDLASVRINQLASFLDSD